MPPVAMDVVDDGEPNTSRCHTVFVDTSLDTHLAMTVEELDSVADFKKKIHREHALCFPEIGDIGINALQVKRRGFQYHLPDSMFVRNAFDGVNNRWFVYADASRPMKQGLDILGQGNGILRLEHNVQKDDPLNGKADGDAAGGAVMKVLEDLEIDFEHLGDDHFRTPSSVTHKRVETKVDRGSIPNGTSDQVRKSGEKRKMDEYENRNDHKSLNGDVSTGHENEAITAKKRRKSEKKDKSSSKRNSTKTSKSTVDASVNGARNVDTIEPLNVTNSCVNNTAVGMLCHSDLDGHKALHPAPTADGKLESENGQIYVDPVNDQSHVSLQSIGPTNVVSNGEDALHPGSANEDSSMEKITVDGTRLNGPDPTAASVSGVPTEKSEPSTKRKKKKTKSETLLNQLPLEVPVSAENSDRKQVCSSPIQLIK